MIYCHNISGLTARHIPKNHVKPTETTKPIQFGFKNSMGLTPENQQNPLGRAFKTRFSDPGIFDVRSFVR